MELNTTPSVCEGKDVCVQNLLRRQWQLNENAKGPKRLSLPFRNLQKPFFTLTVNLQQWERVQTKSMKTIWSRFVDEGKTMDGSVPGRLCQTFLSKCVFFTPRWRSILAALMHCHSKLWWVRFDRCIIVTSHNYLRRQNCRCSKIGSKRSCFWQFHCCIHMLDERAGILMGVCVSIELLSTCVV